MDEIEPRHTTVSHQISMLYLTEMERVKKCLARISPAIIVEQCV